VGELGVRNRASLEMHLQAVMERIVRGLIWPAVNVPQSTSQYIKYVLSHTLL